MGGDTRHICSIETLARTKPRNREDQDTKWPVTQNGRDLALSVALYPIRSRSPARLIALRPLLSLPWAGVRNERGLIPGYSLQEKGWGLPIKCLSDTRPIKGITLYE